MDHNFFYVLDPRGPFVKKTKKVDSREDKGNKKSIFIYLQVGRKQGSVNQSRMKSLVATETKGRNKEDNYDKKKSLELYVQHLVQLERTNCHFFENLFISHYTFE